jgi:two-component system phosphate regulon sensor histidine kinase PhoR
MANPSDTTEAHRKLIELNDELENYFRNTVIPQLFVDANMILRKFTPPAMLHFQLQDSDVGRHINEVSSNIRFPTINENIEEVIQSNKDLEKEIQTTDLRWYQMNILPYIVKKDGKANGVIITFVDINSRIEVLRGYEKLNRDYENIIYAISHDMKGPITNIEALINILRENPEPQEAEQVMEMLGKSLESLRTTVNDLTHLEESDTDFAKAEERVNFGNLIEDAVLALKNRIHATQANITSELIEAEVTFSRKNVRSIVYNLISNAIKFKAPDRAPDIFIKTEKQDGYILLSVTDNGLGIEKDRHDAIFARYTRLRADVEGSGVGLYIVKRMVEDMSGKIEVESTVDAGTTFNIYFKDSSSVA